MSAKPVIVITGKKGSGKDTFGKMVMDVLGELGNYEVPQHLFFAEPLKQITVDVFGVPPDIAFGDIEAKETTFVYGRTVRHWQQWLGAEVFRDGVHKDIWVHLMLRRIIYARSEVSSFVITDCRFPNEWVLLRRVLEKDPDAYPLDVEDVPKDCLPLPHQSYKCHLVRVIRPSHETSGDTHVSETSVDLLDAFDPTIVINDGSLEDLREQSRTLVTSLLP